MKKLICYLIISFCFMPTKQYTMQPPAKRSMSLKTEEKRTITFKIIYDASTEYEVSVWRRDCIFIKEYRPIKDKKQIKHLISSLLIPGDEIVVYKTEGMWSNKVASHIVSKDSIVVRLLINDKGAQFFSTPISLKEQAARVVGQQVAPQMSKPIQAPSEVKEIIEKYRPK